MKTFWTIMVGLLVVLSLASFAENMYLLKHAPDGAKRKCANAPGWYYPSKYTNCLRGNM